jgi:hypothetical protein
MLQTAQSFTQDLARLSLNGTERYAIFTLILHRRPLMQMPLGGQVDFSELSAP